MKIRLLSDLHMEGYYFQYQADNEDVIVLAGNIHSKSRHEDLLKQIPSNISVILVAGNTEYYESNFDDVNAQLKQLTQQYPNFHYLQNESIKIGDVNFYGGTMFTDFKLHGDDVTASRQYAQDKMSDFSRIYKNNKLWTTKDHEAEHKKFVKGLVKFLSKPHEKRVVISHFMPTYASSKSKSSSKLDPYFIANMEQYMGWKGFWLCGHGNNYKKVSVGDTKIEMNAKGYNVDPDPGLKFIPYFYVEI